MNQPVDFDGYTQQYDHLLQHQLQFFDKNHQYFAEYKVALSKRILANNPQTILDAGCGIGRSLPFLKKYFEHARVTGCDISLESLRLAKQHHPDISFHSLDRLLQLNTRFDFIFLSCVLHHIAPAERPHFIAQLVYLLNPQGYIIIFEHNPLNPITRKLVAECPFDKDVVLLPRSETLQLLSAAGLSITHRGYTLFFPASLKWLRPLDRWLSLLPFGGQYLVCARREHV